MSQITLLGRARKRKHKKPHAARKPCQKADGRLKKGWRYGASGRCVRAKAK